MKKVLLVALLAITFTLTGCEQVSETVTDLQDKITQVTTDLNNTINDLEEAAAEVDELTTSLTDAESTIDTLTTSLEDANAALEAQNKVIADLQAEVNLTNTKIKNALNRDSWTARKVKYNADWTTTDAEYCFGIFDEDWSTLAADDYKVGEGLKFVITIEQVQWGTEVFVKDSCGNYSEFILDTSSYGLYSTPVNFFEVGATYEVVLYKEMYFTSYQLGLLPLTEMAEFGAYPEDISGIYSEKQE